MGKRTGNPMGRPSVPLKQRLWKRVIITESCWLWNGTITKSGYGQVGLGGRNGKVGPVHRIVYEILVGPVPKELHLDHLCRVRHCCNPNHLEPVTPKENWIRGIAPVAIAYRKGTCVKGLHPMVGDNVYIHAKTGNRCCRACAAERWRKRRDRLAQE